MKIGQGIYISLGYATAHCAIGVTGVSGTITDETEKAVQVTSYTSKDSKLTCWFPKKALVSRKEISDNLHCSIAKWFKPSEWTESFLTLCSQSSVISA